MTELLDLAELRLHIPTGGFVDGTTVLVKNHSNVGDNGGGFFMWRTGFAFTSGGYSTENYGAIIKSYQTPLFTGSWVRQYDGFINVLYFGAFGTGGNYTEEIRRAIEFAETNAEINPQVKSSTIYIPNGSYVIDNITLKSGIDIIGESLENTNIYATEGDGGPSDYLFKIEKGRNIINISNLNIIGVRTIEDNDIYTKKGCFKFEADWDEFGVDAGLWYSSIKNVQIRFFKQNGIYLLGGSGTVKKRVNQFNVFENVRIVRHGDGLYSLDNHALKMLGQNGQHTFINCQFDGFHFVEEGVTVYDRGINVMIENGGDVTTNVATFMNCTFQEADYGIIIKQAENITIDNCWFEYLGVAITVEANIGFDENELIPSKSINILNNRFANASGFGSIDAPKNIKDGQCVSVKNSVVNVYDNFVTASYPEQVNPHSLFVLGFPGNYGLNVYGNTFRKNHINLRRCFGVKQDLLVDPSFTLFCNSNKLVFVSADEINPITDIKRIESSINPGEMLTIRCETADLVFYDLENIFLTNRTTFKLSKGEIATFIKIDIGINYETYQLVSFVKTTPA